MSAQPLESFLHRAWTLHDLEGLPDDGYRYEILDGGLAVSPAPSDTHQILVDACVLHLSIAHSGRDRRVVSGVGVTVPADLGNSFVVPDVIVATTRAPVEGYRTADQVETAVEVVSPGSQLRDRSTKRDLYAAMGVPRYLVVDPLLATLTLYADPRDREYAAVVRVRGAEPLPLFGLSMDGLAAFATEDLPVYLDRATAAAAAADPLRVSGG